MALGDLGATDFFSLEGDNWHPQGSTVTDGYVSANVYNENGLVTLHPTWNQTYELVSRYTACSNVTSFTLSLGTGFAVSGAGGALFLPHKAVYSHSAGSMPTVEISAYGYPYGALVKTNPFPVSLSINPVLVQSTMSNNSGNFEATSVNITYSMDISSASNEFGNSTLIYPHNPYMQVSESGSGRVVDLPTCNITRLDVMSWDNSDSNTEMDTYAVSFEGPGMDP